jgi:hypothetical protein
VPASGFNGYASNGFVVPYATDQAEGALPAGVNVLKEASCMSYGAPLYLPDTDEGRAMLQIVHAVAPGASLAFHTAVESEADFANGIIALANAGAKVIVDDIGYVDEPFYQDGLIAQAIDQVAAQGVTYFSAAGNAGPLAYENLKPTFPVANASATEQLLNFDLAGDAVATSLDLTIPELLPGEYVPLILAWDQPFVTGAPGSPGASSSLDCSHYGDGRGQSHPLLVLTRFRLLRIGELEWCKGGERERNRHGHVRRDEHLYPEMRECRRVGQQQCYIDCERQERRRGESGSIHSVGYPRQFRVGATVT